MCLYRRACRRAGTSTNPLGQVNDIQSLWGQAEQKIQSALGNLDGAVNFVLQSQNNHPNRHDVCRQNTSPSTGEFAAGKRPLSLVSNQPANAFASAASSGGAFGQPSALGQKPNPFSTGGVSAFGQPSAPTQISAFGQSSALGGGGVFGQPSALGGGAFGQTSALGQKPSPFGQPSTLGPTAASGFGQTSALGPKPNAFGAPAFGQPTQPTQLGSFGQPSQLGAKPNPFSTGAPAASASPFGAPAFNNTAPSSSPFGAVGAASNTPSPFGQAAQQATPSPFGQPAPAATASPFGQPQLPTIAEVSMYNHADTPAPNPFAAFGNTAAAPANSFGQPAQPAASNPFAQAAPNTGGFAAAAGAAAGPYPPGASRQHPTYTSYATKAPTGQLQAFKGKAVTYKEVDGQHHPGIRNFDGSWTKIWFPDGPPGYYKDTEPDRAYTDQEKAVYEKFVQTGKFELAGAGGGGMPEAPPLREFCTWDI